MLPFGTAINFQKEELARLQIETARALTELHIVEQQVADQRRAKSEAYNEQYAIQDAISTLNGLIASLLEESERVKNNSNKDIAKLSEKYTEIKKELEEKIILLKKNNEKIAVSEDMDEKIALKKEELNYLIAQFSIESDQIEEKRKKLENESEKAKKLKEEADLQASINKQEKLSIEKRINELTELENLYGNIVPKQ